MEIAKEAFYLVSGGIVDCFTGIYKLLIDYLFPRNSPCQGNIGSNCSDCIAFGLYYMLTFLVFHCFLLQYGFDYLVSYFKEDTDAFSVKILPSILHFMFCTLWIMPIHGLSRGLNIKWYQDIANVVLLQSGQKKYEDNKRSKVIADYIQSFILQMIFCFQGCIIYLPTYINEVIVLTNFKLSLLPTFPWYMEEAWYAFHCALLSSLYAFEYKWMYTGVPLKKRLFYITTKWPYYLGFGSLLASINFFLPSVVLNWIVFSMLFPVNVIGSAFAHDHQYSAFRFPLPVFKFADYLSDWFVGLGLRFLNNVLGGI